MANESVDNVSKLKEVLGFDPTRRPSPTVSILSEIKKELNEEREKKAKEAARDVLVKAMALAEQMETAKRQFISQEKKFNKELGKLIKGLDAALRGQSSQEEEAEDAEEET